MAVLLLRRLMPPRMTSPQLIPHVTIALHELLRRELVPILLMRN
jgi:hypothetical protein